MPVIGITDREGMFMEIGRIRKGGEKTSNAPGENLDYFRVVFRPDEKEAAERFRSYYGDKPRMIHIRIAFPDIPRVWDANYEAHVKGGMVAQATGDASQGGRWRYYYDPTTGITHIRDYVAKDEFGEQLIANGPHLDKPLPSFGRNPVELKMVGKLLVVIPEIPTAGYMVAITHSVYDCMAISQELKGYQDLARQENKTLCNIPFVLVRREEMITKKIDGKKVKMPDWMMHIVPSGEWTNRAMLVWNRLSLEDVVDGETKLLAEPNEAWDDEEDDEPAESQPTTTKTVSVSTPKPIREPHPSPLLDEKKKTESEPAPTRPYPPLVFREKLQKMIADLPGVYAKDGLELVATEYERKVLASCIDTIFGDKGVSRHPVCSWLVGTGTTADMNAATIQALFLVLGIKNTAKHPAQFNDPPSAESIQEFRMAYEEATKK